MNLNEIRPNGTIDMKTSSLIIGSVLMILSFSFIGIAIGTRNGLLFKVTVGIFVAGFVGVVVGLLNWEKHPYIQSEVEK